jgi:tetratricopeptide (TPR) repeat protein
VRQKDVPAPDDHGAEPAPDGARDHDDLPDDPAELAALSQARLAEFDLEAARAAAVRLAEVSPDSLEAHRALAAVALAAQDYPQAELHYGKVLEIEPLDEEAHERLAMARKGRRREERQHGRRRKG